MGWLHANGDRATWPRTFYAEGLVLPQPFPPLRGRLEADLCIIGAGITGLSAAIEARRAGLSVIVLEARRVGWGASGRNGGQIGSGFNWDQEKLASRLGTTRANALWDLSEEAKALTRAHIEAFAPEADYRPGILHVTDRASELPAFRADGAFLDQDAIAARIGSRAYLGGLLDESAGSCNPLAYVLGLARAAKGLGAVIHEGSEVLRAGETVQTQMGQVRARHVLQATNGYSTGLAPKLAARVLPINNYIAVTEPLDPHPMAVPVAVADTRWVVNYWRQSRDGRLIFGGGESYGKRFPTDIEVRVRANLSRVFPELREVRFAFAWGGTLAVTATRLPYLAETAPGRFAAGGYSGHGLALAGLCGRLVVEAICGDRTRFDQMANLPVPALPGGRLLGPWLAQAGMLAGALSDRLRR